MRKVEIPGGKFKIDTPVSPGPAPILQWLKIEDLVVDDGYQRDLKAGNWKSIRRIAENFSWSRFSPVFVAPIEGGKYTIIDGQHRTHAALQCGFEQVPCQIVPMDREEQARSFAAVNGMVTKVTVWNLLKAELASQTEWAVRLEKLCADAGCTLSTSNSASHDKTPGVIYAVTGLRKLMETYGDKLSVALKLVRSAEGYGEVNEVWTGFILIPLLGAMLQRPKAIAKPEFKAALEEFQIWTVVDEISTKTKARLRAGLPTISKKDLFESAVIDWIDKTFPERVGVAA